MGFLKKVFRPVRKIAKKIIPKEIRPALPFITSAAFGPAGIFANVGTNYVANAALRQALAAGLTSAATDEKGDPLRVAALAAAPALISQGVGALGEGAAGKSIADFVNKSKTITDGDKIMKTKTLVERAQALAEPSGIMDTAKVVGGQTAIDQSAKLAEINQDEIDKYNEELRKQGVLDKTKRRTSIFNIYLNAGYEPDYVNSMLDRYGYESGGRIGFAEGLGIFEEDILENISRGYKGSKDAMKAMFRKKKKKKEPEMIVSEKGDVVVNFPDDDDDDDDAFNEALATAERGLERLSKPTVQPTPMMKFARGGEVEEEVEESGIMMASAPGPKDDYDDIARELFGKGYKDLTPEEMEIMQEELERLMNKFRSSADDEGIMQMASGYKTDIEEMYEQYVFEMEEQGLEPMSFAQFLAQARAGMKDGGKAKRRKKGQEDDSDGKKPGPRKFPEFEDKRLYEEKMPQVMPGNKPDMMDAAMGGIASMADGGIMEKDMRGGGFIPEGSKERADDVPARLSKNEFVMTADAVRAAGGGSVNKGAKRMYDMMYSLEGKI
jgi:hypothetical protein